MSTRNGPARAPLPGQPVLLYLRMVPVWVFVDEVRQFVESFCACAGIGAEREGQLASYVRAMGADPKAPGGLGLPRIRYEAQLELEAVEEGDRLTVSARGKLMPAQLSAAMGVGHG